MVIAVLLVLPILYVVLQRAQERIRRQRYRDVGWPLPPKGVSEFRVIKGGKK